MAFDAHLDALKRKHLAMSDAVEQAQRSPSMDGLKVANMKKEQLRLKEEITRLSSGQIRISLACQLGRRQKGQREMRWPFAFMSAV